MADAVEPPDDGALSPAAAAFAEFLARIEGGEEPDFDAFCREHEALAAELRQLHARWLALRGAFGDLGDAVLPQAAAEHESDGIRLESDDASSTRLLQDLSREDAARPRYTIAGEFARGGMAALLRVRDKCLRRTLAMKVLLAQSPDATDGRAHADPRTLARFLEEAQITGQLDHPGIPPVHELGIDSSGRVFFTMPLIQGNNLSQVYALLRDQRDGWTLPRAVAVLQRVCETVAYAHSRGVVHRDLKPSNIMVGRFGETYVMDWGLARVRGRETRRGASTPSPALSSIRTLRREIATDTPDSPLATMDGQIVGTPAYMAPEQARGEVATVGPPSDVYSIGAMLYELLLGQTPYIPPGARLSARTILARVVEGPPASLRMSERALPQELVAVCEKAMARDAAQRYAGASELGADLRAWLEGRVVQAHATGAWAELRKWIDRNRVLTAAALLLLSTLVVGLVVTTTLRHRAAAAAVALASELRLNNIQRGRLFAQSGNLGQAESLLWTEHVRTPEARETRWALWEMHAQHPCRATAMFSQELRRGVLAEGERTFVVADSRGRLFMLDPATLSHRESLQLPTDSGAIALAADGAGRVFSAHEDGALHVSDVSSRRVLRTLRVGETTITDLAYCEAGSRLLVGLGDGSLLLYDASTWSMRRQDGDSQRPMRRVAWRADGAYFAALSADMVTRVYAGDTGALVASCRSTDALNGLAFGGDGELLFGCHDRTLYSLDPASGRTATVMTKPDAVGDVWPLDRDRLAVCGWRRIDVWSRTERRILRTFELPPLTLRMLTDVAGRTAFTVHRHEVRAWDLADSGRSDFTGHDGRAVCAISPDGRHVFTGDAAGVVRRFDPAATAPAMVFGQHDGRVRCLAMSPDGAQLASGSADGKLRLWNARTGQALHVFDDHDDTSPQSACFSPDGRTMAAAVKRRSGRAVALRSSSDFTEIRALPFEAQVIAIAYSPDGRLLACSSRNTAVRVFDAMGQQVVELPTTEQSWGIAFRPDGRQIAVGTWGRTTEVFDVATGARQFALEGHAGTVWSVGWLPQDPSVLHTSAADGRLMLWDVDARRPLLQLEPFGSGYDVISAACSGDGRRLVVAGASGTVVAWDIGFYEQLLANNMAAQAERARSAEGLTK